MILRLLYKFPARVAEFWAVQENMLRILFPPAAAAAGTWNPWYLHLMRGMVGFILSWTAIEIVRETVPN